MDAEQREPEETAAKVDVSEGIKASAIRQLAEDRPMMEKLTSPEGAAWGAVRAYFLQRLPTELDDRGNFAYNLVKTAMDQLFGQQGRGWETYRHPETGASYVRKRP